MLVTNLFFKVYSAVVVHMAQTVQILIDLSVQKNRFVHFAVHCFLCTKVDISEHHYHLSSINKSVHAIKKFSWSSVRQACSGVLQMIVTGRKYLLYSEISV